MQIVSHRGIDNDIPGKILENSTSSLNRFLRQGIGVECDLSFTSDNRIVLFHDANLSRATEGADSRSVADVPLEELQQVFGCELYVLEDFLCTISSQPSSISAIHLKGRAQQTKNVQSLIEVLRDFSGCFGRFIIFDCRLPTARILKEAFPSIHLAPSVAHQYDIDRFNVATEGTLYSQFEVLEQGDLFDWVWLDEWDLKDANGASKRLYSREVFETFRQFGKKIGLVTPELHFSSPALLGGEYHEDGAQDRLMGRIGDILGLRPDLICTDYPTRLAETIRTI